MPGQPSDSLVAKRQRLEAALRPLEGQTRLAWLVEQSRQKPVLPATLKTDANRVEGCLAQLWLASEFRDGRCWFQADSDSQIVRAIASLLCEFYSGETPAVIIAHDPGFLRELGITQHLTPNRRNGVARVWDRIRAFAAAHATDKL